MTSRSCEERILLIERRCLMQIYTSGMKGKKHSEEAKAKMREAQLKRAALVREALSSFQTSSKKDETSPVYSNEQESSKEDPPRS
jgi:hypothetical protein